MRWFLMVQYTPGRTELSGAGVCDAMRVCFPPSKIANGPRAREQVISHHARRNFVGLGGEKCSGRSGGWDGL